MRQYLERYPVEFSREIMQLQVAGGPGGKDRGAALKERDDLYEPAIEVVIREGRGSCSLLAACPRDRLRPRGQAHRLHGRRRHRRRIQERVGSRSPLFVGRVGSPQERRRAQGRTPRRSRGVSTPAVGRHSVAVLIQRPSWPIAATTSTMPGVPSLATAPAAARKMRLRRP